MKTSQASYDGWFNADKQWKIEWATAKEESKANFDGWTTAKEESKANFDGWTAANNEAKQNWDRFVCAAKNLKKEEAEVQRLRETVRQASHGASTSFSFIHNRVQFHPHRVQFIHTDFSFIHTEFNFTYTEFCFIDTINFVYCRP